MVLFVFLFLLAQQYFGSTALGIVAFIIVRHSSLNSPQAKYFKSELNNQYIRKKWGKPLGLALGGLVGYLICIVLAIAGFYNTQAGFWSYWGDYDQAISDFTKAIDIDPSYANAYNNRGISYFFRKEYEKAWDDVHKAQSLGHQVHPEFLNELREASGREK